MHKGYAFVQYANPFDARKACHGEDGRTVLSQVLGKLSLFNPLTQYFTFPQPTLTKRRRERVKTISLILKPQTPGNRQGFC